MKELLDKCTIVFPGSWNVGILLPPWVGRNILQEDQVNVTASFNPDAIMFDVSGRAVKASIARARVQISPVGLDWEKRLEARDAASRLLAKLPHTPIEAVGLNFGFEAQEGETELQKYFSRDTDIALSSYGATELRSGQRQIRAENYILNIEIWNSVEDNGYGINLNFHFPAEGNEFDQRSESVMRALQEYEKIAETALEIARSLSGREVADD